MNPIENLLGELLSAIRPIVGSQILTMARIEEAILEKSLEDKAKEVIGRQSKTGAAKQFSEEDRFKALLAALMAGLEAPADKSMKIAAERLESEFSVLRSAGEMKWVAFVPLSGASRSGSEVDFQLDSIVVPCAILPVLTGGELSNALKKVSQQFGTKSLNHGKRVFKDINFLTVFGASSTQAAEEAVARFTVVRDAIRYAGLAVASSPRFDSAASGSFDPHAVRRIEILLCPSSGQRPVVKPIWASDTSLEIDVGIQKDARWRKWYDRSLRLLREHSSSTLSGSPPAVGSRLSRSLRIISRASSQSNPDIRFLLSVVALETLVSRKEEIGESVADIGARLLSSDRDQRLASFTNIKQAYDARSRLVHGGELPSLVMKPNELDRLQTIVLKVWAEISKRLFDLADKGLSEKDLFEGLDEFRGVARLKYGASWEKAFGLT